MIEYIVLGLLLLFTLGIILFLFVKLTPNSIPSSLVGYFRGIVTLAVSLVVVVYGAVFVFKFIFG